MFAIAANAAAAPGARSHDHSGLVQAGSTHPRSRPAGGCRDSG
nr:MULTISPECIES: hypothetical protein [Marinobacter]